MFDLAVGVSRRNIHCVSWSPAFTAASSSSAFHSSASPRPSANCVKPYATCFQLPKHRTSGLQLYLLNASYSLMLGAFPTFCTTAAQSTNNGSSGTFCPLLVARSRLHSRSACVNEPNSALICRRDTCPIFITSNMLGVRPSFCAQPTIASLISCFVMHLLLIDNHAWVASEFDSLLFRSRRLRAITAIHRHS